jgi:hypothetical protein
MAERRLIESAFAGIPEDDILQQARVTIDVVAQGRGGPRAAARLAAAQVVSPKPSCRSSPTSSSYTS